MNQQNLHIEPDKKPQNLDKHIFKRNAKERPSTILKAPEVALLAAEARSEFHRDLPSGAPRSVLFPKAWWVRGD